VLTRRAAVGVAGALAFVISAWNVPVDGKVSSFALLVVVAGLAAAEAVPAGARRMSVAAVAVLLASYARPELYLAAPILAAAAMCLAYREARAGDRRGWRWAIVGAVAILGPVAWAGAPAFGRRGGIDRLREALQEHFAWNWNRWHQAHASVVAIWRQEFGAADTPLAAVRANPSAVARTWATTRSARCG
jgi:hypothetical protein